MIEALPSREKEIIEMRFGLGDKEELTQKEVADELGISQSYISRIEKSDIISIHLGSHTFNTICANKVAEVLGMTGGYSFFDERTTLDYILQVYPELQDLYLKYALELVEKGKAYYCFCSGNKEDEQETEQEDVKTFVVAGKLTKEQYKEITGEAYPAE